MIRFNIGKMLHALNAVSVAAGNSGTMAILENVYISYGETPYLLATDTDVQLVCRLEIFCGALSGSLLLPLKKLTGICKAHDKSEDAVMDIKSSRLVLKIGAGRYSFNKVEHEDYPVFALSRDEEVLSPRLSSEFFRKCLKVVAYAQAINDVRFFLNGIHISIADKVMHVVATDGHRLALFKTDVNMVDAEFTLQRKGVEIINKALDEDSEVEVSVGSKSIEVVGEHISARSKLIDGKYPTYKSFFENKGELRVLVNRVSMINGLRRASIVLDKNSLAVKLTIEKSKIAIHAKNDIGESVNEEVACSMSQNLKLERGFNPGYLIEAASVINTENIELWINPNRDSGVIIMGEGDDLYSAVVMQMRL